MTDPGNAGARMTGTAVFAVLVDRPGGAHEKRGNVAWLGCACGVAFPVAPSMLEPTAPAAHCPGCGANGVPQPITNR